MDRQMMLLLVVMVIALLYTRAKDTDYNKKICVAAITVLLALFSGLRSWWLGDLIKYYTDYLNCNGVDWRDYVFQDYTNMGLPLFFRGAGAVGISFDVCIFIIAVFFAVGVGGAIASSMSVLNFPQSGHLPSHFGEVYPHSEHTNCVVALGMGASYAFTGIKSTVAYTVMPLPSPT